MFAINSLFKPMISTPGKFSEKYTEIKPCSSLKPYIQCYWGTPAPYYNKALKSQVIIPDACADIVVDINYSTGVITGNFFGIHDIPFYTRAENRTGIISNFGIRFYFWAVHLFIGDGLNGTRNTVTDVAGYFPDFRRNMENIIVHYPDIKERIFHVERYLLKKLHGRFRQNNDLLNAVYRIIRAKGVISVPEVCGYTGTSKRRLERLFSEYTGISPKKAANLVRYQNVWRDTFLAGTPDYNDIVFRYGYTDQAHLLHDFKKHHGMTPAEALHCAGR